MANAVLVGDALFGLSQRNSGQYFLLDVKTGKTLWTGMPRQAENAAIVRAGNAAVCLQDDGELIVGAGERGRFDPFALHGLRTGDVGAAGRLRESNLRQGRLDARALDAELTPRRRRPRRCASRAVSARNINRKSMPPPTR